MKKESYPKYPTVKATKDNKFVLEVSYEVGKRAHERSLKGEIGL